METITDTNGTTGNRFYDLPVLLPNTPVGEIGNWNVNNFSPGIISKTEVLTILVFLCLEVKTILIIIFNLCTYIRQTMTNVYHYCKLIGVARAHLN